MKISIIIPVFNDINAIALTLNALREQTYTKEDFEVIVVDNGSKDGSIEYLEKQQDIIFIKENLHLGSPYSCRNRGIEKAKGDIFVFLDSTCVPQNDFLEKGLAFFENNECDMFGGNVKFFVDDKSTGSQIYDSLVHIRMQDHIENRKSSPTACLWVKRYVIDTMGTFKEGVRSGEDLAFTSRCTNAGMVLLFGDTCISYKFARKFSSLAKKYFRVGQGKVRLWKQQNKLLLKWRLSWRYFVPIAPKKFKEILDRNREINYTPLLIARIYTVSYVCKIIHWWGMVVGTVKLLAKRGKK